MKLLSIKEAALEMNVSVYTIRKLIASKRLKALKILNKYRIDENDLIECFRKMEV